MPITSTIKTVCNYIYIYLYISVGVYACVCIRNKEFKINKINVNYKRLIFFIDPTVGFFFFFNFFKNFISQIIEKYTIITTTYNYYIAIYIQLYSLADVYEFVADYWLQFEYKYINIDQGRSHSLNSFSIYFISFFIKRAVLLKRKKKLLF